MGIHRPEEFCGFVKETGPKDHPGLVAMSSDIKTRAKGEGGDKAHSCRAVEKAVNDAGATNRCLKCPHHGLGGYPSHVSGPLPTPSAHIGHHVLKKTGQGVEIDYRKTDVVSVVNEWLNVNTPIMRERGGNYYRWDDDKGIWGFFGGNGAINRVIGEVIDIPKRGMLMPGEIKAAKSLIFARMSEGMGRLGPERNGIHLENLSWFPGHHELRRRTPHDNVRTVNPIEVKRSERDRGLEFFLANAIEELERREELLSCVGMAMGNFAHEHPQMIVNLVGEDTLAMRTIMKLVQHVLGVESVQSMGKPIVPVKGEVNSKKIGRALIIEGFSTSDTSDRIAWKRAVDLLSPIIPVISFGSMPMVLSREGYVKVRNVTIPTSIESAAFARMAIEAMENKYGQ